MSWERSMRVFGESGLFGSPESGTSVRCLQGGILRPPPTTQVGRQGEPPREVC